MLRIQLGCAALVLHATLACAQEHPHPPRARPPVTPSPARDGVDEAETPLGLPHSRHASGTAWQPDSTPLHAVHAAPGRWMLMAHGNLFVGYDHQGSDR